MKSLLNRIFNALFCCVCTLTGSKHDYLFCYCPPVDILFEVLRILVQFFFCQFCLPPRLCQGTIKMGCICPSARRSFHEYVHPCVHIAACYALVNVKSQGPLPWATQGILMVFLTHTGESDSLINTDPLKGYLTKNILTLGNSDPNLKELLHIFSIFHLLPVNPHPLTQGFSDRK